ncbi:MAG: elongation factor Ts [Rickettsiales bacterium]|nr:elongation factor Ts [Rickettsiales bacterium]
MKHIDAKLIKQLRDKTGAGMMDCKKALVETEGDFNEAIAYLRKKGQASASGKTGRMAAEGIAAILIDDFNAAIIEVNSETDFVARNEKFHSLVDGIRKMALKFNSVEELKKAHYLDGNKTVEEEILSAISVMGENITLRRIERFHVHRGVIGGYIHNSLMDNGGKIAVLVVLESDLAQSVLQPFAKQLAMHVAAAKPEFLVTEDIDEELLRREEEIFREQAKVTGKPDNVIDKMVAGKMQKYYQEVVLLQQGFIIDPKTKIIDVIKDFEKEHGGKVELKDFARYQVGEGL